MDEKERKNNHILFIHQKLLKDSFIKDNLILSIIRVFYRCRKIRNS